MKIMMKDLLQGIKYSVVSGNTGAECEGLTSDSRQVRPGYCFVCIEGTKVDGHSFARKAVELGAKTLIVSKPVDVRADCVIQVKDPRRAMALMAATWYGHPSKKMMAIAVTGSDGKTSTTYLLRALLKNLGYKVGIIGTILREWPGFVEKADMTTPDPLRLQASLKKMLDAGVDAVVLEASSHALDQGRLAGLHLDMAIFTNLTRDHLDYHITRKAYSLAKQRLFNEILAKSEKKDKACVLNMDDPEFDTFAKACPAKIISYGFNEEATIHPVEFKTGLHGSTANLITPKSVIKLRTKLVGRHNMYNIMAAMGTALIIGRPMAKAANGISSLEFIPGRLQRVDLGKNAATCFVDYAHTPAALENVISVLDELTKGRLIVVFGAGGDRDKGKRPLMGKAACAADSLVLTSDNPRTEDPMQILKEIEAGVSEVGDHPKYVVIEDRKKAIYHAIDIAGPNDTILVAGKGHEDYQIKGTEKKHFDDVETIMEYVKNAN